jgi:hypothetical protein
MDWQQLLPCSKQAYRLFCLKPKKPLAGVCAQLNSPCRALNTTSVRPFIPSAQILPFLRPCLCRIMAWNMCILRRQRHIPFDDGNAAMLYQSVEATAQTLGADAGAYRKLMQPLAEIWPTLAPSLLGPLKFPANPLMMAQFGLYGILPSTLLAKWQFKEKLAKGLFAGMAAHSILPLVLHGYFCAGPGADAAGTCKRLAFTQRWHPANCQCPGLLLYLYRRQNSH